MQTVPVIFKTLEFSIWICSIYNHIKGTFLGLCATVAMLVLVFRLMIKIEIREKKDKCEIDVEDEDWAADEEEHRESAVIGMTALSLGKIQ